VHGDTNLGECPVILSVNEDSFKENTVHFVQNDGELVKMMGWTFRMVVPANVGMGAADQMVEQAPAGLGRLRGVSAVSSAPRGGGLREPLTITPRGGHLQNRIEPASRSTP
jgi:hypothetical protein